MVPREGCFQGIATWRFAAAFVVNMLSIHSKMSWPREGLFLVVTIFCVYICSATIALLSLSTKHWVVGLAQEG